MQKRATTVIMFGRRGLASEPDVQTTPPVVLEDIAHSAAPPKEPEKKPEEPKTGKVDLNPEEQFAKLTSVKEEAREMSDEEKRAKEEFTKNKEKIHGALMEQIDLAAASKLPPDELRKQILELIGEVVVSERLTLNHSEQHGIATEIIDDMLGLGPLEPLLKDERVTDILINGPLQVYVERKGKLELTDIKFRNEQHLYGIAQRIVTAVGRRVDESNPICDARLADGSRVNVIAPPLSLKGTSISIRKFSQKKITLDVMAKQNNLSENVAKVLKIAAACRLNVIISGGTGSGKTTLLNALSQMIDHGERIVTIEDAAELQLQQPHVVPLETRPPNLEGQGEINMRHLVKNALRMRPERIILGEVRGPEAIDMLQAMNTGHDGSMGTLHANTPREALTRLENMISMASATLPQRAIRQQIAGSVNMIIQISRMRDGMRRIQYVTEIVGMEGDVVITQDLFKYEFEGEDNNGMLIGSFKSSGLRPHFTPRAAYYGLDKALLAAIE